MYFLQGVVSFQITKRKTVFFIKTIDFVKSKDCMALLNLQLLLRKQKMFEMRSVALLTRNPSVLVLLRAINARTDQLAILIYKPKSLIELYNEKYHIQSDRGYTLTV